MEVDLVTSGLAEQDSVEVDDYNTKTEAINFEGERCGICMDIIIDRGVLDCCQHWFCFVCIDNWATITNLCPLCQNEFQLITCVPVYDTIGTSKVDDDLYSRDDDWSIEGTNNTLSFPSYYIDENAVICLDGDGCKIRNGSAAIDGDSNFDTSIACDSCDLWYHAFCVGFDPEGTSEGTWLCPRCVVDDMPQKTDGNLERPSNNPSGFGDANVDSLSEDNYSGKVSISVADSGETAIVISMVGRNKVKEELQDDSLPTVEVDEDLKTQTFILTSEDTSQELRTPPEENSITWPILKAQELELSLSCDTSSSVPSSCLVKREVVISADKSMNEHINFDGIKSSFGEVFNEAHTSNDLSGSNAVMGLHLGLSVGMSLSADEMNNNVTDDQMNEVVKQHKPSEEHASRAEKCLADVEEDAPGTTGVKRKLSYCSAQISANANGDDKTKIETEASSKKMRVEGRFQPILPKDMLNVSASDDSENAPLVAVPSNDQLKCLSEQENAASDIMSIVRGTTHRPPKGLKFRNAADKSSKELENVAGLRVKKIMKRAAEDRESSMVVQKLRKEIREAVRNKSVKDYGENLFDPKLLAAFRAAVAGPRTESAKTLSQLAMKAKKSMLQKGKVRENLTKKIYAHSNGRRKRAWDRDCEIEFWKHRCQQASKPEKIQTLKSVLDLLRNGSESTETVLQGSERQATDPILSRLYLADTSVFPRKDDIKPFTALKTSGDPEVSNKQTTLAEKRLKSSLNNSSTVEADKGLPKVGKNSNAASLKDNAASRSPLSSLGSSKPNTHKEASVKSEDVKTDKRKWALEVLARKTGGGGESVTNGKQEDMAVLKGNYPLLAQLPIDMRPVLAPSCRNKIPMPVRQAQLYRITEHLLRKANLPVIRRTAETELAVADAVNIEKEVADRANSKPVYLNLCSQTISHRSENKSSRGPEIDSLSDKVSEIDSPLPSTDPADISKQSKNELSTDPIIQEALKNAGLLSDSPPNSPDQRMEVQPDEGESSINIGEDGPEDILEMDNVEDLDIYGEFEYSLDDEDYIGVSAPKVSNVHPQEGASKMKLVFSTLQSGRSSSASDVEKKQNSGNAVVPNNSSSTLNKHTDVGLSNSIMEDGTENSLVPAEALFGKEGEEPSVAECEELYGPDKEPLIKNLPEGELTKLYGISDAEACLPRQAIGNESCVEKSTSIGHNSSAGESSSNHSEMSETACQREKKSNADSVKWLDNSIYKKVEAYIKEHVRPLCKSGVITAEQYRWAVAKTTEKVMKYHCKDKNANFLIKEGEKVKKLAEQYVETAKQKEKSSLP